MESPSFQFAAMSVLVVGVLEGITPCPHSWPVVLPFAVGAHKVHKAMLAALAFFLGKIAMAPLVGALLGGSHHLLPAWVEPFIEWGSAGVVFVIAGALLIWPDAFHLHTHCEEEHPGGEDVEHGHRPGHEADPEHPQGGEHYHDAPGLRYGAYTVMFLVGAGTMLVPGLVWGWAAALARSSHSWLKGAILFELHAVASGAVVLVIAYAVARFAWAVRGLGDQRVEAMLVRITSLVVMVALVAHMALGHGHEEGHDRSPGGAPPAAVSHEEPAGHDHGDDEDEDHHGDAEHGLHDGDGHGHGD